MRQSPYTRAVLSALALALLAAAPAPPDAAQRSRYGWLDAKQPVRTLVDSFATPPGFTRVNEDPKSFGAFLRTLPLLPGGAPVLAFDGSIVHPGSDPRVAAVAELDIGNRDLQQCADSIIRLNAEWHWANAKREGLSYTLTSGAPAKWDDWRKGMRPKVAGQKVTWSEVAAADGSHASFRKYLDFVFTYAGTRSLSAYSKTVDRAALQPGDFFVLPAKELGHAVLVLDLAEDGKGHRVALVGQGFMPAQSFHVLASAPGQAWFALDGDQVATPFWAPFPWTSLRRLP